MLKVTEPNARKQYPGLLVAALGPIRKDKPNGVITALVLFDESNGTALNRRTRLGDQGRSLVATDLQRAMREKARIGERTFALNADKAEATCTSTKSEPSESPPHRTTGHAQPQHSADCHSSSLEEASRRGIS